MGQSNAMTIGRLSRRTGESIKVLRTKDALGFLCTRGRSDGNYRLFGEETLRCVQVVRELRSLGLTLKEIQAFIKRTCQQSPSAPVEELLQEYLAQVLARVETKISALQALQQRILEVQSASADSASPAVPVLIQMGAAHARCDSDHVSS